MIAGRSMRQGGVLLIILLGGCSGDGRSAAGFVNETQHSAAQLWTIWQAAQAHLSRQIDLNPLQRVYSDTPAHILPGDPRAWDILPRQIRVASKPDVPSVELYSATGVERSDPTGLIACPQPCNVQYTPAYSFYEPPLSRYAASWELSGNNFDLLVQYEFENHILHALGYDMRWR
jgi:hypothetical protein